MIGPFTPDPDPLDVDREEDRIAELADRAELLGYQEARADDYLEQVARAAAQAGYLPDDGRGAP